jgi:DivIVA domain-containing protein
MTLSLDDVRNKRFRMARKGGYEVLEVDEFVDEVEESFAQLFEENASLKKQVDALRSGSSDESSEPELQQDEAGPQAVPAEPSAEPAQAEQSTPAPAQQPVVVTTSAEASTAVVRLVQLSTEQAEHLVREAHEEASRIREDANRDAQQVTEDARTRAERLESEAQVKADSVQAEAQSRTESLDQELSQRRTELFGDLDQQRDALTETVARLRSFEQQYRSSLHDHLSGQLSSLERVDLEPEGGPERTAPAQPTAATDEAQPVGEPTAPESEVPADHHDNGASTAAVGSSDTPRLDALLGDQR